MLLVEQEMIKKSVIHQCRLDRIAIVGRPKCDLAVSDLASCACADHKGHLASAVTLNIETQGLKGVLEYGNVAFFGKVFLNNPDASGQFTDFSK